MFGKREYVTVGWCDFLHTNCATVAMKCRFTRHAHEEHMFWTTKNLRKRSKKNQREIFHRFVQKRNGAITSLFVRFFSSFCWGLNSEHRTMLASIFCVQRFHWTTVMLVHYRLQLVLVFFVCLKRQMNKYTPFNGRKKEEKMFFPIWYAQKHTQREYNKSI